MGNLVRQQTTAPALLESKVCVRLVSLLRNKPVGIIQSAMCALCFIAETLQGARAIVDAKILDDVLELLEFSSPGVQRWTCMVVIALAPLDFATPAILDSKACVQLVTLLRDHHPKVTRSAMKALSRIAQSADGAHAIVKARILDDIFESLESLRPEVQRWTGDVLESLALTETAVPVILESKACVRLVSLLGDRDSQVIRSTMSTLSSAAERLEDASVTVSKTLDHLLVLLESSSPEVWKWSCILVGNLVRHESTAPTILDLKACWRLVSSCLREAAASASSIFARSALRAISNWPDGVAALVDMAILGRLRKLSQSSDAVTQLRTRGILDNLARSGVSIP